MLKTLIVLCVFMTVFLAGCRKVISTPTITITSTLHTPLTAEAKDKPEQTITAASTAIEPTSTASINAHQVLENAVANLLNAASFEMTAHEVRAYQMIGANGETSLIYGEFNTNYSVIRSPTLKVHSQHEYRYDLQDDFLSYDSYSYQEDGQYFTRLVENSVSGAVERIDLGRIEPMDSDVYQTLVTYSDQAKFLRENDGIAVYVLEHPKWYKLKGAIGFADLGFLYMQQNGEQLVEQYVEEHFPNVKTILFTIYVAVEERVITRIEINDSDFMASVLAEVDRALVDAGANAETRPYYEIMDINGSEYSFSNYNQIQDFAIPE